MAKYSIEFKMKVVQQYLEGAGETSFLSKNGEGEEIGNEHE